MLARKGRVQSALTLSVCTLFMVIAILGTAGALPSVPTISINDVSVVEGDAGSTVAVFTVSVSAAMGQKVDVSYRTSDLTASSGLDYAAVTGTLTIKPRDPAKIEAETQQVEIPINGDVIYETDEAFTVQLFDPQNAVIADGEGIGTISDQDPLPRLAVSDAQAMEGDSDSNHSITEDFEDSAMLFPMTGSWGRTSDSADSGGTSLGSPITEDGQRSETTLTVTFPAGAENRKVGFAYRVSAEGADVFEIYVNGVLKTQIADSNTWQFIQLDNLSPLANTIRLVYSKDSYFGYADDRVYVDSVTQSYQTKAIAGQALIDITLAGQSAFTATVEYQTVDGSAISGRDYTARSGSLTFMPGEYLAHVTVPVYGDSSDDPDRVFSLILRNPQIAQLEDPSGAATITDDDQGPMVTIRDLRLRERYPIVGSRSYGTVGVHLDHASALPISIAFASRNGTADSPGDYKATSGTLIFAPGEIFKNIPIEIVHNAGREPDEAFHVDLLGASGARIGNGSGIVTIIDFDTPHLEVNDTDYWTGNAVDVYVYVWGKQETESVAFDYTTVDGTGKAGEDYVPTTGTIVIPPARYWVTIPVSIIDDGATDPREYFSLQLSDPVGARIDRGKGRIVLPADGINLVSHDIEGGCCKTEGSTFTFVVTLERCEFCSDVVTVDYATFGSPDAVEGVDYTPARGTIVFSPGEGLSKPVVVQSIDDRTCESKYESVYLRLSNPRNAQVVTRLIDAVIIDNDC